MEGKVFVSRLLHSTRYRRVYDSNSYFREQVKMLEKKKDLHTYDLLNCMVNLSNKLIQKDLDMIAQNDNGYLREDDIL